MKKSEILRVQIVERASLQKTIAYHENKKILIEGGYIGDICDIRLIKVRSSRADAVIVSTISSLTDRQCPPCPSFPRCGGCSFLDIPYEKELQIKEEYIRGLFTKAGIECPEFESITPSPSEYAYRNKMEFSFGDEIKQGPLTLGMHEKKCHHNIISLEDCKISPVEFNTIRHKVEEYFKQTGSSFYNKFTKQGFLRHLVLRKAHYTGEVLVNLVTTDEDVLDEKAFVHMLLSLNCNIVGILHTKNSAFCDVVKADEMHILYGRDFIQERLLGLSFTISAFSFFQTNSPAAEKLYGKVVDFAGDTKDRIVFDLYCGTGTIAQIAAGKAKKVYGIELNEQAVTAARKNAALNGLNNCTFIAGDVLSTIDELDDKPELIILDPPRAGLHKKAIPKIIHYRPEIFVYVSCKATSLIEDLPYFLNAGYRIEKIAPVDMFPRTQNVETVVRLKKYSE